MKKNKVYYPLMGDARGHSLALSFSGDEDGDKEVCIISMFLFFGI